MFDLLLKGGTVVDGTGAAAYRADLGIVGDRIAVIGDLGGAEARQIIDITGKVVAPGAIDIHSHSDFTLLEDRPASSIVRQGVTTEVVGNCGTTYAPLNDRNFQSVTSRSGAMQPSVDVTWRSVGEFLDEVRKGNGVNCYFIVGHTTIRASVIGNENRPATPDETRQMQVEVERALDEGARGMSTGLEFMPGAAATAEELRAMADVVGRRGGIVPSHIRNRDARFVEAVDEMIDATRPSATPLQLSHLMVKPGHAPGAWEMVVEHIERARREGHDVAADMIPYDTGPGLPTALLPGWALEGGPRGLLARLKDPKLRAKIRTDYDRYWRFVAAGEWDRLTLLYSSAHPEWIGRSFDSIAAETGLECIDVLLKLFEDEGEDLNRVLVNGRLFSEEHVRACLTHPLFSLASDGYRGTRNGGPGEVANHPNCWGWVPKILGYYVRDEKVLTLEEAVRKMTSMPAERIGVDDRGRVEEGLFADLMVFDPATVGTAADFLRPAVKPDGVTHVFVNGQLAVKDGELTGALAGRVL